MAFRCAAVTPISVCSLGAALFLAFGFTAGARAAIVTLDAAQDTTLYETPDGGLGNGAGQHIFSGVNSVGRIRRALIAFDVAGGLPAGALIEDVSLSLHLSLTVAPPQPITLHAVAASWGEGASVAAGQEGGGAPSQPGDATWLHRFYPSVPWIQSGGDFSPVASASTVVASEGAYAWSSPAMVSDVQLWVDEPGANAG